MMSNLNKPNINAEFGPWKCANLDCANHSIRGMEAPRLFRQEDSTGRLVASPNVIVCGKCKTPNAVEQV